MGCCNSGTELPRTEGLPAEELYIRSIEKRWALGKFEQILSVEWKNNRLSLNLPGQMTYSDTLILKKFKEEGEYSLEKLKLAVILLSKVSKNIKVKNIAEILVFPLPEEKLYELITNLLHIACKVLPEIVCNNHSLSFSRFVNYFSGIYEQAEPIRESAIKELVKNSKTKQSFIDSFLDSSILTHFLSTSSIRDLLYKNAMHMVSPVKNFFEPFTVDSVNPIQGHSDGLRLSQEAEYSELCQSPINN